MKVASLTLSKTEITAAPEAHSRNELLLLLRTFFLGRLIEPSRWLAEHEEFTIRKKRLLFELRNPACRKEGRSFAAATAYPHALTSRILHGVDKSNGVDKINESKIGFCAYIIKRDISESVRASQSQIKTIPGNIGQSQIKRPFSLICVFVERVLYNIWTKHTQSWMINL